MPISVSCVAFLFRFILFKVQTIKPPLTAANRRESRSFSSTFYAALNTFASTGWFVACFCVLSRFGYCGSYPTL